MPRKTRTEHGWRCAPTRCFNEAAARCRGKPRCSLGGVNACSTGFNEAAARCRGKPKAGGAEAPPCRSASMRPRPDAAENRP